MKRKAPSVQTGIRFINVLSNFSGEQLMGIGGVAMSFNDAQRSLHELLGPCLRCPPHFDIVAKRINGLDGIVAIIQETAKNLIRLDAARVDTAKGFSADLDDTLRAFKEVKQLRDAVVHANIFDTYNAIGILHKRDHAEEVLLTTDALQWLIDQTVAITGELRAWKSVFEAGSRLLAANENGSPASLLLVQAVLDHANQARSLRKHRKSRKHIHKFPPPLFPANTPL